jgi:predicted porin
MSYTLQYGKGPLAAAVNITDQAQTGNAKITTIFASYDLGVAKIGLTQQTIDMNAAGAVNPGAGTAITVAAPMGAGILSAGYGSRKASAAAGIGDDVKQTHVGYRYNLSKRTHLNLIWNNIDRQGSTKTNDVTETHLVVGHTFSSHAGASQLRFKSSKNPPWQHGGFFYVCSLVMSLQLNAWPGASRRSQPLHHRPIWA